MTDEKVIRVLRHLHPLDQLDEDLLATLAGQIRVARFAPGDRLAPDAYARSVIYLLDGEFTDPSRDSRQPTLREGRIRPLPPLSDGDSAGETLAVHAPARVLLIDRAAWEQACSVIGYERKEDEISEAGGQLLQRMHSAYREGRLNLPAMPELSVQVQRLADAPDTNIGDLVRLIQSDPVTTGRIIQAANGPLHRADRPVTTLGDAVGRLGMRTTAMLARSVALRGTFRARTRGVRERMQRLWTDTARVASLGHAIARRLDGFDPDTALLAGLIHDIGVIPILHYAEDAGITADQYIERCIRELRAPIGLIVLSNWRMEEYFMTVLSDCERWQRDTAGAADYCDIIVMARVLLHAEPGDEALNQLDAFPAWRNLGLDRLADGTASGLLREAEDDITSMEALLHA